ncbi:hypothetical protein Tco_1098755, partial [Tanacetum coccineum]
SLLSSGGLVVCGAKKDHPTSSVLLIFLEERKAKF